MQSAAVPPSGLDGFDTLFNSCAHVPSFSILKIPSPYIILLPITDHLVQGVYFLILFFCSLNDHLLTLFLILFLSQPRGHASSVPRSPLFFRPQLLLEISGYTALES